ncbi:uncharacterized protein LOC128389626 isoform X2 [Panonychus citri]|nr:uncharacterized protein LOC128389626 isoform X2 [Panonychus citri]
MLEPCDGYVDLLDNRQILKKTLVEGRKDRARPEKGCRVKLNVTTKLKDSGVKIDSECYENIEIFVGDCDINHALDLVVPHMNEGEIANVFVSAQFAYGEKGRDPDVPSDALLDLTIEVVSIERFKELTELDSMERIKIAEGKKEKGNFYFSRSEYSNSIALYKRAIEFLDIDPSEIKDNGEKEKVLKKLSDLQASCYNNLAQAHMKKNSYDAALDSVNASLAINDNNVKALFRKGKILSAQGNFQEALEVFKEAVALDPDSSSLKAEYETISWAYQRQLEEEKNKLEPYEGYLDILDNRQILKKTLAEGRKERARPEKGCRVKLNLTTKLKSSGAKIDSECYENIKIFVGDCDIHHAVDLVVPLMDDGEIANVIVSPRFAYGDKGRDPDIPPNAALDLTIEVVSIDWVEELNEIDAMERIKIAEGKKEKGNFHFSRSEYSNSITLYKRAIEFLDIDPSEIKDDDEKEKVLKKISDLKSSCYNNLAQAHMKMDAYDAALDSVNASLAIDEKNVKALFRKGKILCSRGYLDEALEVFKAATSLEPDNRLIKAEYMQTSKACLRQLEEERKMFKKMLQLDNNKSTAVKPDSK